jgi:DDE superfamily endonuclease
VTWKLSSVIVRPSFLVLAARFSNTVALPYLTNSGLFHHQFPVYAENIAAKMDHTAVNVWGLINRTLTKTCQPTHYQAAAYSGHKHKHGSKFQNVTMADGYLAQLYGPIVGSLYDSYMLACSNLLPQLHAFMPVSVHNLWYAYRALL